MKEPVVILGGGGHARVVVDILEQNDEIEIAGFTDESARQLPGDYAYLGDDSILEDLWDSGIHSAFVAIGDNERRRNCAALLHRMGFRLVNAISRHAIVSPRALLDRGIAIMPGAVINAGAWIGPGVIVNTRASVDHDCIIGDFAHVGPGVTLAGSVNVGRGAFLGTGSCAIPGIRIGCWTTIGAGAVVVRDLPDGVIAKGVPAIAVRSDPKRTV